MNISTGNIRPRSTKGCWTCRRRKVKCDENRPVCETCTRLKVTCDYAARPRKPYKPRRKSATSPQGDLPLSGPPIPPATPTTSPRLQHGVSPDTKALEREAERYYRMDFTPLYHTKDFRYNLLGMIYELATKSALVMHMVVAISRAAMLLIRSENESQAQDDEIAITHYSAALRQVAAYTQGASQDNGLDDILAAVYLMLLYEQKFGDHHGSGLSDHLKGLASIIQKKSESCPLLHWEGGHYTPSAVKVAEMIPEEHSTDGVSLFAIRTLEWICVLDAGAASFGLGGDFNAAVHAILARDCRVRDACYAEGYHDFLHNFSAMQSYSNQLSCRFWGLDYPIAEFADDISTNELYSLYGCCVQLRYLISTPAAISANPIIGHQHEDDIWRAFRQVYEQYTQYFLLANRIDASTNNSSRIICDLRFIIPHYYAACLLYLQTVAPETFSQNPRYPEALTTITNLALQAFEHQGDGAMLRIAWPLFILTLSTRDFAHRSWSFSRLHALSKYGRNYARAAAFAGTFIADQQRRASEPLDLRTRLMTWTHGKFAI